MNTQEFVAFCEKNYSQKRVLITGADGFVSGYLFPLLHDAGADTLGVGLQTEARYIDYPYEPCDLRDIIAVRDLVEKFQPEIVFHLASQSSVGTSWTTEWQTIESNVQTAHNLMRSLEHLNHKVRVLAVSSGEVYGDVGPRAARTEDPLRPQNPYAVSKAMMEVLLHRFKNTNVEFVIARAFSHTGAGRPVRFFEASVASQFAKAFDKNHFEVNLEVGNLEVTRDYSDVREVAMKYLWLASQGKNGEIYNVCTGAGVKLSAIVQMLERLSGVKAVIHIDSARLRKNDIPYIVGENSLKSEFLSARFPLENLLSDLMSSFSKNYC